MKNTKENNKKNLQNISQYKLTQNYIETLVKLLPNNDNTKNIDLIFSSGAFNVLIGVGVGMYLKNMEKFNKIKVNRVSGSSIGAFLSLWYIMDDIDDNNFNFFQTELINTFNNFKKNKKLDTYNSFIKKYVYKIFKSDDMTPIQKRLFITYYDTKKYKKRIVCNFKNREHLISCILRSSYLPYITDGNTKYKNRYIDGITPFVFTKKSKCDILYVDMMCKEHIYGIFIMNPKDFYKKILIGINDVNDFFVKGKSHICFYTKDITYRHQIEKNLIDFIFFIILFMMDIIASINLNTKMIFSNSIIYNILYDFIYNFFKNIIDNFLFN